MEAIRQIGLLVDVDRLLAVEKLHITHKNSLALGTKREVVGNNDVDVGWERSEPIVQQINTYFQVSAVTNSHEVLRLDGTVAGSV